MILGVGIDVVDIARFGETLERTPGDARRGCSRRPSGSGRWRRWPPGSPPRRRSPRRSGRRPGWTGWTPRSSTTPTGDPRFDIRGSVQARADELGVAQRARLAVPRRRDRLRRRGPGVLSGPVLLAADRFATFGGEHLAAARAVPRGRRRGGAAGTAQRGTPAARRFSRVLRRGDPLRDGAEPGVPAHPRGLRPRHLAARCSCATWPGWRRSGRCGPTTGCRSR